MPTWTDAQLASIHKMLNPRSIAVVGATPRLQYGGRMLAAALKVKDSVKVYPVNPRYDQVMGTKCYPSVADLPEAPDTVGVVVPYDRVLDVLRESHQRGAGSAIIISAGFAERGLEDRGNLQKQLGEFAQESGLRVSGPNCLGMANLKDDIWVCASSLGATGLSGPVGLVCQSGASAFGPFLSRAIDGGIGFTYLISTGNEADLDFSDFVRYLLDDEATKVIAGFVEGFKDARKFIEVAKLAAQRGKPLVLIKIGRSELGSRAALSHTAALTGSDALYDAVLSQFGVIRVQDYDELLEVSQLLASCPKPINKGIAVVSHSGGISSITADMCGQAGLDLPQLSDCAREGINGVLKGFGWAANPADVTGFAMGESFPEIMDYMIQEPDIGTLVVASSGADSQAEQVISQRDRAVSQPLAERKGLVFLWTGSREATSGLPTLKQAQIPIFYTPHRLAEALSSLQKHHTWRERQIQDGFPSAPAMDRRQQQTLDRLFVPGARRILSEHESKQLISAWDIPITKEALTTSAGQAAEVAGDIGYPVALKVDSPDIPHKTEVGVIRLGLDNEVEVRDAYTQLMSIASQLPCTEEIPADPPLRKGGTGELGFEHGDIVGFSVERGEMGGSGAEHGQTGEITVEPKQTEKSTIADVRDAQVTVNGVLVQEMVTNGVEVIVGVTRDPQLGPVLLFGTGGVMAAVYNDVALRLCPISLFEARQMVAEVRGSALLQGFRGSPPADVDALVRVSHMAVNLEDKLAEMDINPLMVLPAGKGVKAADALVVFRQ